MNKLTGAEIISKIEEHYDSVSDFAYDGDYKQVAGPNKQVDSTGGEDRGSHWTRTYHFTDHDVYLKVTGYYQSHYGTDFDDGWNCVEEVKPVSKTITIYE
jgi:hypothetical protein